jgi:hypothetical protein
VNKIRRALAILFSPRSYTLQHFAVYLLVILCIQYIPLESRAGVSPIKVVTMAFVPLVLIRYITFNKAFVIGVLYAVWIFFTAYILHPTTFRASTVMYLFMFLITFVAFYTFVWDQHVFTLDYFICFLKRFIYVLVGVLLAQQICLLVGIQIMPVLNLSQVFGRGIGANSLTFEPSTLGRLLNVLYYAFLKCNEYRCDRKITVIDAFSKEYRWVTLAFLWAMLTMGSGTAFIALGITSLYFMRGFYFLFTIPIFAGVYYGLDYFGNQSFERARVASEATLTGNSQAVIEKDGSAAMRIAPILNTLNIDLTDENNWVGNGCDSSLQSGYYADKRFVGQINDYGLISYIIELLFIFSCVYNLFSLPTLLFFTGVGGGFVNISYSWGIFMIFTCVKYFHPTVGSAHTLTICHE